MAVVLSEKAEIARRHRGGKRRNFWVYVQELGTCFIRDDKISRLLTTRLYGWDGWVAWSTHFQESGLAGAVTLHGWGWRWIFAFSTSYNTLMKMARCY